MAASNKPYIDCFWDFISSVAKMHSAMYINFVCMKPYNIKGPLCQHTWYCCHDGTGQGNIGTCQNSSIIIHRRWNLYLVVYLNSASMTVYSYACISSDSVLETIWLRLFNSKDFHSPKGKQHDHLHTHLYLVNEPMSRSCIMFVNSIIGKMWVCSQVKIATWLCEQRSLLYDSEAFCMFTYKLLRSFSVWK